MHHSTNNKCTTKTFPNLSTFFVCLSYYVLIMPSWKVITQLKSNNSPLLIFFLFRRGELIFFFIFAILVSAVCGTGSCSGLCKGNTWTCFLVSLVSQWWDNRVTAGEKKKEKKSITKNKELFWYAWVPKQWKMKGHNHLVMHNRPESTYSFLA